MWEEEKIKELQDILRVILRDIPHPHIVYPDGIYGSETTEAVRIFQQLSGLPETGEVDLATWEALTDRYFTIYGENHIEPLHLFPHKDFILQKGASGLIVGMVQSVIRQLAEKYSNLPVPEFTLIYDDLTEASVRHLQQIAEFPQTGEVDRKTWNLLAALNNSIA